MIKQDELEVLVNNYSSDEHREIIGVLLTKLFGTQSKISVHLEYGNLTPVIQEVKINPENNRPKLMIE